mmetsp:Transcript_18459/g.50385  ORF Transcript_18459/g.50385 Transcript_18459/m.50385 type:complete len:108 (+) Transcript_18459:34-357(+)
MVGQNNDDNWERDIPTAKNTSNFRSDDELQTTEKSDPFQPIIETYKQTTIITHDTPPTTTKRQDKPDKTPNTKSIDTAWHLSFLLRRNAGWLLLQRPTTCKPGRARN